MSDSMELQDISNVVESILCGFDIEAEDEFTDKVALQLLELAFDKYHFKDLELSFSNSTLKIQFERMSQIIEQDLSDTSKEQLIKVMASIYRSIQRRTNGGREYLTFAQQYVGARVGPGARVLQY
jgi:vacuolar-type H+-ATPase subunit D/Vma8